MVPCQAPASRGATPLSHHGSVRDNPGSRPGDAPANDEPTSAAGVRPRGAARPALTRAGKSRTILAITGSSAKSMRAPAEVTQRHPSDTHATVDVVTPVVPLPCGVEEDVEEDEDGGWGASARLRPCVGAFGDGPPHEDAIAGPRAALEVPLNEAGPPDELTLTLHVA